LVGENYGHTSLVHRNDFLLLPAASPKRVAVGVSVDTDGAHRALDICFHVMKQTPTNGAAQNFRPFNRLARTATRLESGLVFSGFPGPAAFFTGEM